MEDFPEPPGRIIMEMAKGKGLRTKEEIAEKLGYPVEYLENIMCGNAPIFHNVAENLSETVGEKKLFWIDAEEKYRSVRILCQDFDLIEQVVMRFHSRECVFVDIDPLLYGSQHYHYIKFKNNDERLCFMKEFGQFVMKWIAKNK